MQIMWNAHKEFPIHASKSILLSSSTWMGHKQKETFVGTMSGHERLQALTTSYMKESLVLKSLMGFGMGFWKKCKLGSTLIFMNHLL